MQVPLALLLFLTVALTTTLGDDDIEELTTITTEESVAETTIASSGPQAVASVAPAPIKQHAFLDGNTLLPLLLASGGPPGEFPVENHHTRNNDSNCSAWIYEYTNSFPEGVLRHEHAFGEEKAQRQARGLYAKMQPADKPSFAIEYDKNDDALNITATSKCNTTEWNVMMCQQSDGLYKDYVVHGHQDPPCREIPLIPPPTDLRNGSTLEELVGMGSLKKGELPDDYDLSPLLAHFGGAPGEVVSAWNRNFAPLEIPQDPKERPLPDANRASWLYDYRAVNSPHSVRFEHATLRFKGQPEEFVDVRGIIYWRTSLGDFRIEYHQDDTGLRSKLDLAECSPIRSMWVCTYSTKDEQA